LRFCDSHSVFVFGEINFDVQHIPRSGFKAAGYAALDRVSMGVISMFEYVASSTAGQLRLKRRQAAALQGVEGQGKS
jgi:hypothetical protein